jgi:Fe-S-cluster containining protein
VNRDLLEKLRQLYTDIDREVQQLEAVHRQRLQCARGCAECCMDDITVFTVEAQYILHHCAETVQHGEPGPPGACAFLDVTGHCRIYAWRPYVCRTQGLPLHWIEERDNGAIVAYRDICPKNDRGVPVEQLAEKACWEIGPVEGRLARLQYASCGGEMRRIGLRELFGR